jgi:hypothetical protein
VPGLPAADIADSITVDVAAPSRLRTSRGALKPAAQAPVVGARQTARAAAAQRPDAVAEVTSAAQDSIVEVRSTARAGRSAVAKAARQARGAVTAGADAAS